MAHIIPFVGLIVISNIRYGVEFTKNDGEYVVVYMRKYVRNEQFTAEGEHGFQWREIEMEGWSPRREVPIATSCSSYIDQTLSGYAPI